MAFQTIPPTLSILPPTHPQARHSYVTAYIGCVIGTLIISFPLACWRLSRAIARLTGAFSLSPPYTHRRSGLRRSFTPSQLMTAIVRSLGLIYGCWGVLFVPLEYPGLLLVFRGLKRLTFSILGVSGVVLISMGVIGYCSDLLRVYSLLWNRLKGVGTVLV